MRLLQFYCDMCEKGDDGGLGQSARQQKDLALNIGLNLRNELRKTDLITEEDEKMFR